MSNEQSVGLSEATKLFSECFQTSLEAISRAVNKNSGSDLRLLFPRGISYLEFSISQPISARVIVSSDPVPSKLPIAGINLDSTLSTLADVKPVAELHGDYGEDFELDPDVEEDKGRAEALLSGGEPRVAASLLTLRAEINTRFPGRKKDSDGTFGDKRHCGGGAPQTSDHCPWVRDGITGVVTALDITNDPGHDCNADAIARALIASRDSRIKYVISNRQIAASYAVGGVPPWTWRHYGGANPHDKHFHLSVLPTKSEYDSTARWTF